MGTDKNTSTALEVAAAAEANVVGEIVATELADALDNFWMALDDKLVYRGVSEESVAAALHPYGLSEAWLREWCGTVASAESDSPRTHLVIDEADSLASSTSPVEVAEEFLAWIDEVLEAGDPRRSGEAS